MCTVAGVAATALLPVAVLSGEDKKPLPPGDKEIVEGKRNLDGLHLELRASKKKYEQGEPIEVTMRYTYSGKRDLLVEVVTYDHGGRILDFGFTAHDEKGHSVRDPIKDCLGGRIGGLRTADKLTPLKPYEQTALINEWLAFDRPGHYTVQATSSIVSFKGYGSGWGNPSIPLKSNSLEIEIVPFNEKRRAEQIANLATLLKSKEDHVRDDTAANLRFLMDARCIPLLISALNDKFGNVAIQARFGLLSFLDPAPVRAEMLKQIDNKSLVIPSDDSRWITDLFVIPDLRAEGKEDSDDVVEEARNYWEAYKGKTQMWLDRLRKRAAGQHDP